MKATHGRPTGTGLLPRIKPEPLPQIHPVPEYAIEGQHKTWYEEMKHDLQVPWMGVVTMAYAHYPHFFAELWRGLRPLVQSRPFVEAFQSNRALVEGTIDELRPPAISLQLEREGYAPREVDNVRHMIEVFSHGNQPYVIIATLTRFLLEGNDMAGGGAAPIFDGRHAPDITVPFVLMEAHHADEPTRAVYEDIKRVLGLPFVNTDYRAFARWPSYWAAAWGELRQVAGTAAHEAICTALHERCLAQVAAQLPNPGELSAEALRAAAAKDAPLDEVIQMSRLFQWLLPGLITNVAYLRAQLISA
ncbi:MAG: halocarboxylic acid dehydrogenase DehI family protein [Alphaproteobacteria bacterium]